MTQDLLVIFALVCTVGGSLALFAVGVWLTPRRENEPWVLAQPRTTPWTWSDVDRAEP